MSAHAFPDVLIRGGRIFDGEAMLDRPADVLVCNGHIAAVRPGIKPPPAAHIIDAAGCTIMPGLIDCHVHLTHAHETLSPDYPVNDDPAHRWHTALAWAEATLRAGFTTVRDLGSGGGLNIALAAVVAHGGAPGPRIVACGRRISPHPTGTTQGHATGINLGARGDGAVRAAVRGEVGRGARVVKLYAHSRTHTPEQTPELAFTRDEMAAAVQEAHALDRLVAAHVFQGAVAHDAVEAGVDTIEHGTYLTRETADRMAAQGAVYVPTTHTMDLVELMPERPYPRYIGAETAARLLFFRDRLFESVRLAKQAGVTIAAGSDQLGPRFDPGGNAGELWSLTRAGLTPVEALRAATSTAAAALDLAHRTGRLRPGLDADILVVRGDPLADIRVLHGTANVVAVVKAGQVVVDQLAAISGRLSAGQPPRPTPAT